MPDNAVRLLALMLPRNTVYRRSVTSLQAEGFTKRALAWLLKCLIDTSFLPRQSRGGRYLPPAPSATETA
jgi:hypothetical protein